MTEVIQVRGTRSSAGWMAAAHGLALAALVALLVVVWPSAARAAKPSSVMRITTSATRADLVTGPSTLVRIDVPKGVRAADVQVFRDGHDVTSAFSSISRRVVQGTVSGLRLGRNVLVARVGRRGRGARLVVQDHPMAGPLFSGPRIEPWTCTLGNPDDACSHPTEVSLFYFVAGQTSCEKSGGLASYTMGGLLAVPSSGCFAPYDPKNPPASVPTTRTSDGRKVPFIIRVERFWQDRDQGTLAVLYQPGSRISPLPHQSSQLWNHRLVITQGGACGGHHGEATGLVPPAYFYDSAPSVAVQSALERGYMVMSTALNNNYHNCNLALQAESLVIAKEHIADQYGPISYTFGYGCSGGSMSQNQVANAYPGIYQGLITACTFPDAGSTAMDVSDCGLFMRYFAANRGLTAARQAAMEGKQSTANCNSWINVYPFWVDFLPNVPTAAQTNGGAFDFQNCGVPSAQAYDPLTRRGLRCDLYSYMENLLGQDPATRDVYRPLGNRGVLYGLDALKRRSITAAEFVALNAGIGSYDNDYRWQPARRTVARTGLARAYRTGIVDEANNLDQVAIIDSPVELHDIHEPYRSFALRARLQAATGHHANQVIWFTSARTPDPVPLMEQWLNRVTADRRTVPLARKIVADKPASVRDRITRRTGFGTREAAGGPLASDVLQCALRPLRRSQFSVSFSTSEWSTLRRTFPEGVCDWSVPGVGQRPTTSWLSYQHGPGGVALGPAPRSQAIGPRDAS